MGVKKHNNSSNNHNGSSSSSNSNNSDNRLSKSNSVDVYRPPALRNLSTEETVTQTTPAAPAATTPTETTSTGQQQQQSSSAARRERRPDRAVYVPRARRSQTTPPTTTTTTSAAATATLPSCNPLPVEAVTVADQSSSKADDESSATNFQQSAKPKKTKRRERERERGKKPSTTETPTETPTELVIGANPEVAAASVAAEINHTEMNGIVKMDKSPKQSNGKVHQDPMPPPPPPAALRIEDAGKPPTTTVDEAAKSDNDNEVRELQRASKEINRSNRRIMKQTFVSDVLEIPEKIEAACAPLPPNSSTTTDEENEEDDWETMFDESGECLDPKILEELTEAVGKKCKIELPKMDYTAYHIKQALLNEEEFPHVLEVSNFPTEFKTQDLHMLFSQYKGNGFDIKWVDDTHALAVFSSSKIAAEVLTMGHPFVKLKPLAEATLESRLKAKKCAGSLQPYRQRPETCTALARRLVTTALGVKLPNSSQERENERRVLREAKERKLQAAKQRDEAWES